MSVSKTPIPDTALCIVDTQTHALAARALRLSLSALSFADTLFVSDCAQDIPGARHISIPRLENRHAYSYFVTKKLLEHIHTSHVLLIQWDGYIIHPQAWDDDFLNYDYIGARWGFHKDNHNVGNGGFSLRSRRLLEALQDPDIDQFEPEDEKICRQYRPLLESRYGIRFAPGELADRFSFETTYPQSRPFGFHGLFNMWLVLSDDEVPSVVDALPHSVLGSVQALSLAKNFIDLKRIDAARYLLERRLKAFPADDRAAAMLAGTRAPQFRGALPGRNDPCPCGSGKRFKHCCGSFSAAPAPAPDALLKQAMADHQAGRLGEARVGYEAVLAVTAAPFAEHYLGVLDMQEGQPEQGEARIRAALAVRDDLPDFYNNLGLCLRAQGRLEDAIAAYRQALALNPSYAPAWNNIGLDLHKLGALDDAVDAFNRALALDSNLAQAHFSRALVLFTQGDYRAGWSGYEWRVRCPEYASAYRLPPIVGQPAPWQGQLLQGRSLLLIGEQGLGDTIQFIRYAGLLATHGARVGLCIRKAQLVKLLKTAPGLADVYVQDANSPLPAHDFVSPLLSLPRLCGTHSLADVPAASPYLFADPVLRDIWRQRIATLPKGMKIGLSWAGSPTHLDDRNRSCALAVLAPLFDLPGITWISLQLGPSRSEIATLSAPIVDWGDALTDYAETAALISELDLVISVDTSVAHATGALGKPVWILLQLVPDFRWLLDRRDSPWYPTARLFRQSRRGDWSHVVTAVRTALEIHPIRIVHS